jgi:hypothetical protein
VIQAAQASPVSVPPDVAAFAAEQGVTEYLPGVLEMTQRVFPAAAISTLVEDDPEIPNDRHLVVRVVLEGVGVEQAVAMHWQWNGEIFEHCPAPLVCVFRLGMELKE